jgi:Alw26I/Eco31I/Esp3I family type II restriction endonuclease
MTTTITSKYGGRGRPWHPEFIKYMNFIAEHPTYSGMPDVYYELGRIQWEAPSNRASGAFRETHAKRLKWWALQADRLGISTTSSKWISRVAKQIHPTKEKPCKICGRVLALRYVYPQARFLAKIQKLPFVHSSFLVDPLEPVASLITRLFSEHGDSVLEAMPILFATPQIDLPKPLPKTAAEWLLWIDGVFVPSEPRGILSPGAMSNAPDRFDGFHCDNLCCRGTADKGRHKKNLQSYVTDRRVFEYWTAGDWVAADRLMGQLRAHFSEEQCRHGHPGPCAADHIGPISLGFKHRAKFQLLCASCNSAKNNRMYLSDVEALKADEKSGDDIVSWHSAALWNSCKDLVKSDENARRLSKLLRENRHSLMHALQAIANINAYTFLSSLLELEWATYDIEFVNLRIESHMTSFEELRRTSRTTKYADEQMARRCRIAFCELQEYFKKTNRNSLVMRTSSTDQLLAEVVAVLKAGSAKTAKLDQDLRTAAQHSTNEAGDLAFRALLPQIAATKPVLPYKAKELLQKHMDAVGRLLAERWKDDRYVRELKDPEELDAEE